MNNLFGNVKNISIKKIKEERDDLLVVKEDLEIKNVNLLNVIDKQKALIILLEDKIRKLIELNLENKKQAYLSIKNL